MTALNDQFNQLVKVALEEKQALTDDMNDVRLEEMDESAKNPDFFHDNNNSNKPEQKYTTTRIKSRNFLPNISYVGINKEDFYNRNFILDVYLLVTKNLSPFSLDRKVNDQNKHQMIYMLWKECMPQLFYKHICKDENFLYLKAKNVLQLKVSEIITDFLKEEKENYLELRNNLSQYKHFFQYILMYFLRFTARPKAEVSTLKVLFTSCSKLTRAKKTLNP